MQSAEPRKEYAPGDFSFAGPMERALYENAYKAITVEELWDIFKNKPVEAPFMLWDPPELQPLQKHMDQMGHSGCSYALTMRAMEFIAKRGWAAFVMSFE